MGKNRPRMKSTNKRMDLSKWESLRSGWACPCGGLWVSAGVSVGENRPRMKSHEFTNGRCANGSGFRLGGLVPAAGSGFWRAWLWV